MSIRKTSYILAFVLGFAFMLPTLHADELNQATKVTFNQPVHVPGRTLPAGTYWLERGTTTDSEMVRVFNADHSELITTLFTVSRVRLEAADHTSFVFADQGAGKPQAIVAWFYRGNTIGHEFLYAKPLRQELARDKKETVVAGD
jgi:hypothetical protein